MLIFQYAKFKPIKGNLRETNVDAIREKTAEIFTLISRLTVQYEHEKAMKSHRRKKEPKFKHEKEEEAGENSLEKMVKLEEKEERVKEEGKQEDLYPYEKTEYTLQQDHEGYHARDN